MNKVILMGRLTRDPEVRYTQGEKNSGRYSERGFGYKKRCGRDGCFCG